MDPKFFFKKTLLLLFFLINFFLSSCCDLSNQHKTFLKKFLLEEGAIFTLFGDKPLTDMLIFTGTLKDISLEGLSTETLKTLQYDDSILESWNSWKIYLRKKKFKNFRFVERSISNDPLHQMYTLINIKALKQTINANQSTFHDYLNSVHLDVTAFVEKLINGDPELWDWICSNHHLSGLLHGYGEENSRYFDQMLKTNNLPHPTDFSENNEEIVDTITFPIPKFVKISDTMVNHYKDQREKIKKNLTGKDFFKECLARLES